MKVMRACALPLFCLSLSLLCPVGLAADSAGKSAKVKPYPLETCVVSGEKLGGMGEPFVFVHDGREVQLCCKSCKKEFRKNPEKHAKNLAAAIK